MSTDFLSELADTVHQTCKLLEAPEHRGKTSVGAAVLAHAIACLENQPAQIEPVDDEGHGLASWLMLRGPVDDIPFMYPMLNPFTRW